MLRFESVEKLGAICDALDLGDIGFSWLPCLRSLSFGLAVTCRCAAVATHRRGRAWSHEWSPQFGSRPYNGTRPRRSDCFQRVEGGPGGVKRSCSPVPRSVTTPRDSGESAFASAPMNGHLNSSQEWSPSDGVRASQNRSPTAGRSSSARPMNCHLTPISTHLQPHERSPVVPHPHTYRPRLGHLPTHRASPIRLQDTDSNRVSEG